MRANLKILRHYLLSFLLTVLAWLIPILILAVLNRDKQDTDTYVALKTGNLIEILIITTVLLGGLHWLLNRLTDISHIRKLSTSLMDSCRQMGNS